MAGFNPTRSGRFCPTHDIYIARRVVSKCSDFLLGIGGLDQITGRVITKKRGGFFGQARGIDNRGGKPGAMGIFIAKFGPGLVGIHHFDQVAAIVISHGGGVIPGVSDGSHKIKTRVVRKPCGRIQGFIGQRSDIAPVIVNHGDHVIAGILDARGVAVLIAVDHRHLV